VELFSRNLKTNKQIAMVLLAVIFLQAVGLLGMIGYDLGQYGFLGYTASSIVTIVGSLWVLYALHKSKIGHG